MALSLNIGGASPGAGTERVSTLRDGSLKIITTNGNRNGRCDFICTNYMPAINEYILIEDGATEYFRGNIASVSLSEIKPGAWSARVSAVEFGTAVPASTFAPFSFSNDDAETTYLAIMAGGYSGVDVAGWVQIDISEPYEWWRLGEASGTTAVGEMGVQDGTYVDTPTLGVTGAMDTADTAVTLNGTSEYVTVGANNIAGQASWSIAAWAKTTSAAAVKTLYCERNDTSGNAMVRFYIDVNGRPVIQVRDDAGTLHNSGAASGDWADDEWHHFAAVKDGTTIYVYVDGVQVSSAAYGGTNTLTGTIHARIGSDARDGQYWPGSVDEVMIWRAALLAVEVRQVYLAKAVMPYKSLTIDGVFDNTTTVATATLATMDEGLAPGQVLLLSASNFGLVGYEVVVQELTLQWLNATTRLWTAKLGDAPLKLAAAFA